MAEKMAIPLPNTKLIVPLAENHDRNGFDCGHHELNDWLAEIARQHQKKNQSKTYVAIQEQVPNHICGYYALALAEIENRNLPEAWRKKLPKRIPGVRLGRMAVDRQYQNKGLGGLLLIDALTRSLPIYQEAGGFGLFVDAIDQQAAGFYQHFGFQAAPDNPLFLFLPVKIIENMVEEIRG